MAGVANGHEWITGMVCITDACIFTNHGAFTDANASHGYDVCAARNHDPIANLDPSIFLGFQVNVGVQEHILPNFDSTGSIDRHFAQDDDRGRQRFAQSCRKKGMTVYPVGSLSQMRCYAQEPRKKGAE
jgi:hypothetical protein